jgi:hypothetical protein
MYVSPAVLLAAQENWVFFHESGKQKRVYKDIKSLGVHSRSSAFLWLLKEPLLSPHAKASCSLHGEFNEIRYIYIQRAIKCFVSSISLFLIFKAMQWIRTDDLIQWIIISRKLHFSQNLKFRKAKEAMYV